ncbi:malate synthase G [Isoptericola sp. AK164]|uniref:malate synthase G n=1 Tax=Isoptericola sp. AK164 TaxID=3024246 RepID=UPI002418B86B|nr:malate synthase G [Isoptericola sp. AK164]
MSGQRATRAGLDVAAEIVAFVEESALPGTGLDPARFWQDLAVLFHDLGPANRALLATRERLQAQIDRFHADHPGAPEPAAYRAFLEQIGYLEPDPGEVAVTTEHVDPEIATTAGPQLVVPALNARFAVNAANARWGSLYDALYGTDAIPDEGPEARTSGYNPRRGAAAVRRGRELLDTVAPLAHGSHADAVGYRVEGESLVVVTGDGPTAPVDPGVLVGYRGNRRDPASVLLRHHGLHVEIVLDRTRPVGRDDPAGVADVLVEAALTTIVDLEDSVAAVDGADKALGYRNWWELMRGSLGADVAKDGTTFRRTLREDRLFTAPDGGTLRLPGRSLLLVRNVGHLMTTDAVRDGAGHEVPEGILDAAMTALGALADLQGPTAGGNSRTGSVYVVKPKMHGPAEVAFTVDLFGRVETMLGLRPNTLKIGIMDEERRTSVNLRACLHAARERVAFVNTGFLDRTGDEIHTSLHAGPVVPKRTMRDEPWLAAYERSNVDAGITSGLLGHGQIGKGMWAMPDLMHAMLEQKGAQVRAGATTAWVPSPTAATLHALHYHEVDAFAVGAELGRRPGAPLDDLLVPPLADGEIPADVVRTELDTNVQSILGYVVRWVDQGVGCSKVPDLDGVALMEDRATLRISSQLLANWLTHGVVGVDDVDESLYRLAGVVDEQNAHDPAYEPLVGPTGPGTAFRTARALVLEGAEQPNGYTEPLLHRMRREKKAQQTMATTGADAR